MICYLKWHNFMRKLSVMVRKGTDFVKGGLEKLDVCTSRKESRI